MHVYAQRSASQLKQYLMTNLKPIIISGVLVLTTSIPSEASWFEALCPNQKCIVVLKPSSIKIDDDVIPLDQVKSWESRLNSKSPSSITSKGRGALVGGLAGIALLGPVGAVVGAAWGGSEESGGNVQPDLDFLITALTKEGTEKTYEIRFANHSSARRFRMEIPMFTNLSSGQIRAKPLNQKEAETKQEKTE